MLFNKENIEKIKGLIEELNEVYGEDDFSLSNHYYLTIDVADMKVYEVHKRISIKGNICVDYKDVTQVFASMLMYIGE